MGSLPSYLKVAGIEGNLRGATVAWDWTWSGTEHGIAPPNILPDKDRCIVTNQALAGFEYVPPNAGVLTLTPRLVCNGVETTLDPVTMRVGMNFVEPVGPCCVGMIDPGECDPCGGCNIALGCGDYYYGQLGNGASGSWEGIYTLTRSDIVDAVNVICGGAHTIFIKSDCSVWGCGTNNYGQLGIGDLGGIKTIPILISTPFEGVKSVSCGGSHTVMLTQGGEVYVCGYNGYGQLGLGDTAYRESLTKVQIDSVVDVACGMSHTIFLKDDGTVWSCGRNVSGQLGIGSTVNQLSPVQIPIIDVTRVFAGDHNTIVIKGDGSVWGCGTNNYYKLGEWTYDSRVLSMIRVSIDNVIEVAIGADHCMYLINDGTVIGSGRNSYGQLGIGNFDVPPAYKNEAHISSVKAVRCGTWHTVFLLEDGSVWACGNNWSGQLGLGHIDYNVSTPEKMHYLESASVISAAESSTMIIACEYSATCEDFEWHTVAEQITSLNPDDEYPSTWDLTPYQTQTFTPGYAWRLYELSGGITYGEGVVSAQGYLEGLPDSFTTAFYYIGYVEIQIQCREPIPNE